MKFLELPKDHISSILPICPRCSDTKTVETPVQTIKLSVDPEYRTECEKCDIWWYTRKTRLKNDLYS